MKIKNPELFRLTERALGLFILLGISFSVHAQINLQGNVIVFDSEKYFRSSDVNIIQISDVHDSLLNSDVKQIINSTQKKAVCKGKSKKRQNKKSTVINAIKYKSHNGYHLINNSNIIFKTSRRTSFICSTTISHKKFTQFIQTKLSNNFFFTYYSKLSYQTIINERKYFAAHDRIRPPPYHKIII